jgi:hypothetical protein
LNIIVQVIIAELFGIDNAVRGGLKKKARHFCRAGFGLTTLL